MQILVGADPELFVKNPNSGEFISAHGMVPGTKYDPYKVDKGAIQVDGMALEFNIDPARTVDEFVRNITEVETNVVCVERIKEYSETPTEAEWRKQLALLPAGWPNKGRVSLRDYSTR